MNNLYELAERLAFLYCLKGVIYDKGLEKLNTRQKEGLFKTNELHKNAVGNDYKDGLSIIEVWLEKGVVCARRKSGEGYHYTHSCTWY